MLLFCIGEQALLDAIERELRELEAQQLDNEDDEEKGAVISIADDITVHGATPVIVALAPRLEHIIAQAGLTLNLQKSFIVGFRVQQTPNPPPGWRLETHRAKTLGRPLGTPEAQAEWISEHLRQRAPPTNVLERLSPRCAYALLQKVYNHRPDYLRKVTAVGLDPFVGHDMTVNACLARMIQATDLRQLAGIRGLPTHFGGLGMFPQTGLEATRHHMITFMRVKAFLNTYLPGFLQIHEHTYHEQHIERDIVSRMQALESEAPNEGMGEQLDEMTMFTRATRRAVDSLHQFVQQGIVEDLAASPSTAPSAAILLSQSDHSASKWLNSANTVSGIGPTLDRKLFIEALKYRCLIPFGSSTSQNHLFCPCRSGRNAIDLLQHPQHWDTCNLSQGLKTDRHNHVVSLTARLLRSVGFTAEIEPRRHGEIVFEERGLKRPDIAYTSGGVTKYLDVVIASPATATALHGPHSSLREPGAAGKDTTTVSCPKASS